MSYTDAFEKCKDQASIIHEESGMDINVAEMMSKINQDDFRAKKKLGVAKDLVKKLLATKKRGEHIKIVDVGCGGGIDVGLTLSVCQVMCPAAGVTFEVIGCDLLESMLEVCRKDFPEGTYMKCDKDALPFEDESVDCVRCSRLLIHSRDMIKTIREFNRVLKKGGLCTMVEGSMAAGQQFSTHAIFLKVVDLKMAAFKTSLANPHAGPMTFVHCKSLEAEGVVERVEADAFALCVTDYSVMDPGLQYEKMQLKKFVEDGAITAEEEASYLEVLANGKVTGDPLMTMVMQIISFYKPGVAGPKTAKL